MKYILALLFIVSHSIVSAQSYSNFDKARILYCLVKGRVGNFVEVRDSTYLFDVRDCKCEAGLFQEHLMCMVGFASDFYGYPSFCQVKSAMFTTDADKPVQEIRQPCLDIGRGPVSTDTAKRIFLDMLPYHGDYYFRFENKGPIIRLRRIAGCSPLVVDIDYIDLVALIYHERFAKPKERFTVEVDFGTDPKVETKFKDYDADTDWSIIENRLMEKILNRRWRL